MFMEGPLLLLLQCSISEGLVTLRHNFQEREKLLDLLFSNRDKPERTMSCSMERKMELENRIEGNPTILQMNFLWSLREPGDAVVPHRESLAELLLTVKLMWLSFSSVEEDYLTTGMLKPIHARVGVCLILTTCWYHSAYVAESLGRICRGKSFSQYVRACHELV